MTDRDPALQQAVDEETRRLADAVRHTTALADPDRWARDHIEGMYERGWRPWPRSTRIPKPGEGDPQAAARGAEYARDLLNKTRGDST